MRRGVGNFPNFCPECGERRIAEAHGCAHCGFIWAHYYRIIVVPTKLLDLPDFKLLAILKALYPSMCGLVTKVAAQLTMSNSMVMKVLQADRRNKAIDEGLVRAFREALTRNSGDLPQR